MAKVKDFDTKESRMDEPFPENRGMEALQSAMIIIAVVLFGLSWYVIEKMMFY